MPATSARSSFPHGSDCVVTFVKTDDNPGALVDKYAVEAKGRKFYVSLIQLRASSGPWLFGSFTDAVTGYQIWRFNDDLRKRTGFQGTTRTFVYDNRTYVIFENRFGVRHVLRFTDFLLDPIKVAEVTAAEREAVVSAYTQPVSDRPEPPAGFPEAVSLEDDRSDIRDVDDEVTVAEAARQTDPAESLGPEPSPDQERIRELLARVRPTRKLSAFSQTSAPDADHAQFFNNVLAHMCVRQPK